MLSSFSSDALLPWGTCRFIAYFFVAFSHRHGRDSCGCGIVVFIFERLQDVARLLEADILRCKHITECIYTEIGYSVFGIAVVRTECKLVLISESQSIGLLKLCERIPT